MTGSDHPITLAALKKFPPEERPGDWLILARCMDNDVPMQLIKRTTKGEAVKRAKQITRGMVFQTAVEMFDLDPEFLKVVCLSVVKMSSRGVPASCETVELGE